MKEEDIREGGKIYHIDEYLLRQLALDFFYAGVDHQDLSYKYPDFEEAYKEILEEHNLTK